MRIAIVLLSLLLTGLPAWAQGAPLVSKAQLARSADIPTEVAVDAQGRLYVLYGQRAFLDIYDAEGKRLQRRGDVPQEESQGPTRLIPVSQWVGRLAKSLLLATEPGDQVLKWALVPGDRRFAAVQLSGAPRELTGRGAVARDLDGRIFVYHEDSHTIYVFGGSSGNYQSSIKLEGESVRPRQLAVDSTHRFYVLGGQGLSVFRSNGERAYHLGGVGVFYLTGSDRLVAAGEDWIRRFSPDGALAREYSAPPEASGLEPSAVSINDKGYLYLYYRNTVAGDGVLVKLDPQGIPIASWRQPVRFPGAPDPGTRLDYLGRVHWWDSQAGRLLTVQPEGKTVRSLAYSPAPDPVGFMGNPTDMALAPDGTLWLADPGNFRLQRFHFDKGWLDPVPVGIQHGPGRAHPSQLAITPTGHVLCVVHPPAGRGKVVLHRRDSQGKLISQKPICDAGGEPNVKVAVAPDGAIFVYRTGGSPSNADYLQQPLLEKFTSRGDLLASAGGVARNFHLPNKFLSQIALKPQEDMVPWKGGLLLTTAAQVLRVDDHLAVREVHEVKLPYGLVLPDFGGSVLAQGSLWVTDMANRCVHKIPLQGL